MSGISPRQQVALNLADTCIFGGLNDAYGVSCEKSTDAKGKVYWSVLFCKARILDGVIRVYSPNFIMVTWQTAIRDLPAKGKEVFRSEATAKEFLVSSFIKDR
jgi:hypothetical protein